MHALSICAIFKDETSYLREWIEYHKLVGVQHFYLYENENESDDFFAVLNPYIDSGEVTLIHWKDQNKDKWGDLIDAWVSTTQVTAYEHAIWMSQGKTKWLAFIDIDEFIVPVKEDSIVDVLAKYEDRFPGVEVLWDIFGTSNIEVIPSDKLMIEIMNKRCSKIHMNYDRKTILKPEFYNGFFQPPHDCLYVGESEAYELDIDEMVINHYINRCNSYFFNVKLKNKMKMKNQKIENWQIHDLMALGNDEEDTRKVVQRFVPALKKKLGMLDG
jgi:hypothetical protein